ncbi:lymphocyte antigen 6D isoform X2 [Choloepus didactylus]|uniref:lymphocyte antigen 6D isoform X2 n=1 Tax=Choloepus didactylus TaxID=27675 RepID=UPI00189DAA56|nr:lymphocyte antigen 6D isoform X2 [Choloepus didactylus]
MKTILLLFAALAMAARPARALQCHVCSSSTNCRQPQPCSLASRFCKTVIKGLHPQDWIKRTWPFLGYKQLQTTTLAHSEGTTHLAGAPYPSSAPPRLRDQGLQGSFRLPR